MAARSLGRICVTDGHSTHTHTHTPWGRRVGWLVGRSVIKGRRSFVELTQQQREGPSCRPSHSRPKPPTIAISRRRRRCRRRRRARFSASLLAPRRPPRALSRYRGNTTSLPAAFLACFTHTTSSSRSRGQCPPKHTGTAGRGRRRRRTAGVIDLTKREKHTHTRTHLHICTRARTHSH